VTSKGQLLSDSATYFALAEGLYTDRVYEDPRGDRAFWPPGYPFFLLAPFGIFGITPWAFIAGNLVLYVVASLATYRLGRLAIGKGAGCVAVLLLAIWPTHVFLTSIASKELLLSALVPLALLLYLQGADSSIYRLRSTAQLLCSGFILGFASLTQPSLALLPSVIVAHALLRPDHLLRRAGQVSLVVVGMSVVITPWAARNVQVLNAFVPMTTNGGDNFYRANNPMATGGYTPRGERTFAGLSEVERNRSGYRWGLEWIRSNPDRFLALAVKKQVIFLGDDSHGAFEALRRSRSTTALYTATKVLSNVYWLGIWALILLGVRLRRRLLTKPVLLLFALCFVYLLAVASVFESASKHHVAVTALLAVLASVPLSSYAGRRPIRDHALLNLAAGTPPFR
jgi:4-amino-4-deoxy-L-arabinose transferase-like glycosyltransferase